MLSVITRNGVPVGVDVVSRCHGTLNAMTGQPTTRIADNTTKAIRERRSTAAGSRTAAGKANTHRGANIRIVAGHHDSAHWSMNQTPSTAARYAQQTTVSTRRAR